MGNKMLKSYEFVCGLLVKYPLQALWCLNGVIATSATLTSRMQFAYPHFQNWSANSQYLSPVEVTTQ